MQSIQLFPYRPLGPYSIDRIYTNAMEGIAFLGDNLVALRIKGTSDA
jgi:hypothetical protein